MTRHVLLEQRARLRRRAFVAFLQWLEAYTSPGVAPPGAPTLRGILAEYAGDVS